MLIALAGALAIGLSLGLLGSGGSILTVPVLHYLLGQPEQEAIGGSLLVVGLIAAAAAIPHARAGRVAWHDVLWFGAPGMLGAWLGAGLAHWIPGAVQLSLFALTMLIAAVRMLTSKPITQDQERATARRGAVLAGGFGVGVLSGIVGVGGGFLIVPALVLLARVPLAAAVGTSLAVITINSMTGFIKYVGVLDAKGISLDWPTLLLVAAVGIVGSLAGHRLGRRLPQRLLGRIFGAVLVVLAVAITIDLARRLAG
ncbi:MAG TPA: sulfite exporter TauE/SafE family protein [Steroidobacteraceae bacterium]